LPETLALVLLPGRGDLLFEKDDDDNDDDEGCVS
jgi:hypothetical protein